jgi:protease IV
LFSGLYFHHHPVNMSQFFKNVLASCLGVTLAFVIVFFAIIFIGVAAGSGGEKTVSVSDNTVLHLTFDQPVPEQTNNLELSNFSKGCTRLDRHR